MNSHPLYRGVRRAGTVTAVVIGAGHSGLAMSYCLSQRGIDHVLLEKGEVADAWQQRWDSLRLLTPNWQTRLPGYGYRGSDPNGFMSAAEVAAFIRDYAAIIDAPVVRGVTVSAISRDGERYAIATDAGHWQCDAVVMATGACARPAIPACAKAIPGHVLQCSAHGYRNPRQLPEGGTLVVGASASGLQLAEEIRHSGRQVILACGEHVRLPRRYRGRDIQRWLDALGILDERYDQFDDLARVRRLPSPQLVGTDQGTTLDLNRLLGLGVTVTGRLMAVRDGRALFSGSLPHVCALADLKMRRLLEQIDAWIAAHDQAGTLPPPERFEKTAVPDRPRISADFALDDITSVVWATGFAPDFPAVALPVFDRRGRLRHAGGVVAPGLYVMGLPFMRRRKSSFICGAEDDASELSAHLEAHLGRRVAPCVTGSRSAVAMRTG